MKKRRGEKDQSAVAPIIDKLRTVHITAEEAHELRALDKNCLGVKEAIGELELQYITTKSALVTKFTNAQQSYVDRCGAIAKAHGIDPNDKSKGSWRFDGEMMTFTKVD